VAGQTASVACIVLRSVGDNKNKKGEKKDERFLNAHAKKL